MSLEATADDTAAGPKREDGASGAVTGLAGSGLERRAAVRLARELEETGRGVRLDELTVPAGQGPVVVAHATLVVAGSLAGLLSPLAGAIVVLAGAFSFYGERALGLFLLSRLLPRRRTSNVLSPPLGPAWKDVDAILVAGYDVPPLRPVDEWLSRHLSGRLTTDRLLFWAGMVPLFAALMLRAVGIEGFGQQLLQTLTTVVPLAAVAAEIDRHLRGEPLAEPDDLAAARGMITVAGERGDEEDEVAVCLLGAESDGAAGAEALWSDPRLDVKPGVAVIGLVTTAPGARPEVTAREGDLSGVRMNPELTDPSPLKPQPVVIRRDTAAGRARRRGPRAITVVGRGEEGLDLVFDAIEAATKERTDG